MDGEWMGKMMVEWVECFYPKPQWLNQFFFSLFVQAHMGGSRRKSQDLGELRSHWLVPDLWKSTHFQLCYQTWLQLHHAKTSPGTQGPQRRHTPSSRFRSGTTKLGMQLGLVWISNVQNSYVIMGFYITPTSWDKPLQQFLFTFIYRIFI